MAACLQAFAWVRMISRSELDKAVLAAGTAAHLYRQLGPVHAKDLRATLKTCVDLLHEAGRTHEALAIKRELRAPTTELFLHTPVLAELNKRPALVAGITQGQDDA